MSLVPDHESILAAVLSEFGLAAGDGWDVLHLSTLNNSVFGVQRSGDPHPTWVLRAHRTGWRDVEAISSELALMEHLGAQLTGSIGVPLPARSRGGGHVVSVDGTLYTLLSWAPGAPARPGSGLGPEAARLLGQGLAAIHTASDHWEPRQTTLRWDAKTVFSEQHPGLMGADPTGLQAVLGPAELDLFAEIADRTRRTFDDLEDWGVIHADYILGNCLWTGSGGQLRLTVLDFDDFGEGPRLFDLGAVMGNLADFPERWPVLGPAFLAGYRSVHDQSGDAECELPLMMAARHVSQCLWVLGHHDLGQEWIATHLRARMEMARECLTASIGRSA